MSPYNRVTHGNVMMPVICGVRTPAFLVLFRNNSSYTLIVASYQLTALSSSLSGAAFVAFYFLG